jgi:hypothetical protein
MTKTILGSRGGCSWLLWESTEAYMDLLFFVLGKAVNPKQTMSKTRP